jgi:hypothetical protein
MAFLHFPLEGLWSRNPLCLLPAHKEPEGQYAATSTTAIRSSTHEVLREYPRWLATAVYAAFVLRAAHARHFRRVDGKRHVWPHVRGCLDAHFPGRLRI